MLFDTHAHLNDPAFDNDRESLLESLPGQGIGYVMNAGCSLQSSKDIIALAEKYDYLYASVGSHPDSCDEVNDAVLDEYRALCRHPKVKAIGEIGLDYYYEDIPRDIQQKAFRMQMELARELDMPVIIHERDAHNDGMTIVKEFPKVKGVFHCYSGSAEMAKQLVDIVHNLDLTRPVTSALSFPELSTRTGYADVLDASGYNYKEQFYAEDHERFPGRVIYGSENGHGGKAWQAVKDNDYICGQFLWTGVDFLGECHGWPVRISQAGLIDLAGYEKPLYYMRKAFWTEAPFVKISTQPNKGEKWHGVWGERFIWEGNEGDPMYVSVATNQPEAELFLNGESLGKREIEQYGHAEWQVAYVPGELRAVAYQNGEIVATDVKATTGAPYRLRLIQDTMDVSANGADIAILSCIVEDKEGREIPDAVCEASFTTQGDCRIYSTGSDIAEHDTIFKTTRRMRAGRISVAVKLGTSPEPMRVIATAQNLKSAMIEIKVN